MAQIPRGVLEYVSDQVNALSADARARVLRVLESIEWSPGNVAECRDIVLQALAAVMPTYTDAAAQAGADLYDAVREAAVGERMGATAISGYEPDAMEGAVKAFVQDIVDGKPVEQFNRKVLDRVDRDIRVAENVSVAENAALDPLEPRYARIPTGPETCEWCVMLASRGFDFKSEESAVGKYRKKSRTGAASHGHPGCDCRIVQGYPGMEVEGYDPDEYYELWKSGVAKEEKSISKRLGREWDKYGEARTEEAYFDTVGSYIRSFSEDGLIDCEYRAKPKAKELMTARSLAKNGHRVVFRRETDGGRNPDALLDGEICDFKRIESDNPNKIFQNVKRAGDQSEFYAVDLRISRISEADARRVSSQTVRSRETFARKILLLFIDGEEEMVQN